MIVSIPYKRVINPLNQPTYRVSPSVSIPYKRVINKEVMNMPLAKESGFNPL